ncbi:MAG TPA: CopG family transcriptional regulator [Woeseiaceae bacterium]|nr:CopG family transcriptional regulator [Woeseiaceae bacterium]
MRRILIARRLPSRESKAAETDRSISALVNDAVRAALGEDAEDFEAFDAREAEPERSLEEVARDPRRRGKL